MRKKLRILCCLLAAIFLFAGCSSKGLTEPQKKQLEEDKNLITSNNEMVSVLVIGGMDENHNFIEAYPYDEITDPDKDFPLYTNTGWKNVEQFLSQVDINFKSQDVYSKAIKSYLDARENAGNAQTLDMESLEISEAKDGGYNSTVNILCENNKTIQLALSYNEEMQITNATFNAQYTVGENLKKAGLNTLLGMGTVFCILILISLIISIFGIFPKIEAAKKAKAAAQVKTEVKQEAAVAAPAPVVEEELSDDTELVAVIAAAIAAYEGSEDASGYVVRSIRRSKKWQNA